MKSSKPDLDLLALIAGMSQEEQALLRTRLQEGPDYIFEHPAADVTNRALCDIIGMTGGGESEDPDRELSTIRSIATEALRRHRYSTVMYLRKKVERDGKRINELKEQRSINELTHPETGP